MNRKPADSIYPAKYTGASRMRTSLRPGIHKKAHDPLRAAMVPIVRANPGPSGKVCDRSQNLLAPRT